MLELTERGTAALGDTYRRYEALLAEALAGWSPQDVAAFTAMPHRFSGDVLTHLGEGAGALTEGIPHTGELHPQHPVLEAAR